MLQSSAVMAFAAVLDKGKVVFAAILLAPSNPDADLMAPSGHSSQKRCCPSDQWPAMNIGAGCCELSKEPQFVTNAQEHSYRSTDCDSYSMV